jgi:hypothetical protein
MVGVAVVGLTTACGNHDPDETETIAEVEAAFTVSSCGSAAADQTFTGGIDPSIVTPRSYNTCYKGYVVDINQLAPEYTGDGNALDGRIEVSYADTAITDQATCEATTLRAVLYHCYGPAATSTTGPAGCFALEDRSADGVWMSIFGGGQCLLGHSFEDVFAGVSYRVAATARNPSNATRKMRIGTYRPVNIH